MSHARWLLNARRRWWAWGRTVVAQAQPADVYHGHDLPGLGVAVAARHRHGGRLVYDSHDLFLEAGANATRPRAIRRLIRFIEGRWVREADLVVTVNGEIGARLTEMYSVRELAVVHNCVPRWMPSKSDDALRLMSGVPAGSPIVLYHGGFTANRGLGLLMRALLQPGLEKAHLVLLGYGPMEDELKRLAAAESYGGRVHILDPVPPDQLDRLVACADVAAMVNQPSSVNEVLSTPNKLFESIAAGIPIVTSDFPVRRSIVLDNPTGPLGAVCDPTHPTDIADALVEVLSLPADEYEAMRRRCLQAAHDRWNWEHEAAQLVMAYRGMLGTREPIRPLPVTDDRTR